MLVLFCFLIIATISLFISSRGESSTTDLYLTVRNSTTSLHTPTPQKTSLAHKAWPQWVMRFEYLFVEDGLTQSSARCVLQDTQGYFWFCTSEGLAKYNGMDPFITPQDGVFAASRQPSFGHIRSELQQDQSGLMLHGQMRSCT